VKRQPTKKQHHKRLGTRTTNPDPTNSPCATELQRKQQEKQNKKQHIRQLNPSSTKKLTQDYLMMQILLSTSSCKEQ